MIDSIAFNFSCATSLLKAINECDDALAGLINKLNSDVDKAGAWWEGESYQSYRKLFTGPGGRKTILVEVADQASSLSSRLIRIAEKKSQWEQIGARRF